MQEKGPSKGQLHVSHMRRHDAEGQMRQGPLLHSSTHNLRVLAGEQVL